MDERISGICSKRMRIWVLRWKIGHGLIIAEGGWYLPGLHCTLSICLSILWNKVFAKEKKKTNVQCVSKGTDSHGSIFLNLDFPWERKRASTWVTGLKEKGDMWVECEFVMPAPVVFPLPLLLHWNSLDKGHCDPHSLLHPAVGFQFFFAWHLCSLGLWWPGPLLGKHLWFSFVHFIICSMNSSSCAWLFSPGPVLSLLLFFPIPSSPVVLSSPALELLPGLSF